MSTSAVAVAYLVLSCCGVASNGDSEANAANLGKWLEGKGVVEVRFDGPRAEYPKDLYKFIKTEVKDSESDFRLTPGTGGDSQGSYVAVCLEATPANIKRLLSIQQDLKAADFHLNPAKSRVWSYPANALTRAQAEEAIPAFLGTMQRALETIAGVACTLKGGELRYEQQSGDFRGIILISRVTADKPWELRNQTFSRDQTVHLPNHGLFVISFLPNELILDGDMLAQQKQVRQVFEKSVQPLLELETGSAVESSQLIFQPNKLEIDK